MGKKKGETAGTAAGEDAANSKGEAAAAGGGGATAATASENPSKKRGLDDIDAIFSAGKAAKKAADEKKATVQPDAEKGKVEEKARVLLPGQKKKKQAREKPEFTPSIKPRRWEDGLPVYKSYGTFSDMSAGQKPPEGFKEGKCPFDCWCCF